MYQERMLKAQKPYLSTQIRAVRPPGLKTPRQAPFMRKVLLERLRRGLLALLLVAAGGCSDETQPIEPFESALTNVENERATNPRDFTVYTQNVYLGGDTGPIFTLDFGDLPALIAATNLFWAEVQASDVPERVAAIIDELDERRPHLVGLQEVFQFVEVEFASGAPVVVQGIDLLGAIQSEIASRGLPYEVVAIQDNTSTGRGAVGLPLSPTRILQFTDRLVALRRTDVPVLTSAQGSYAATFMVGPLTLRRGWVRVTTEHDGVPYHFVTTHLETQALLPIQTAQAAELINGVLAGLDGVTIVSGDLNSDPENPGSPSWTPTYDNMIMAGFTDAWERTRHSPKESGFTCCQDPNLRNGPPLLDQRIDFVLVRRSGHPSKSGKIRGRIRVDVVGEEQEDRTPTHGLWPADHAGLVATLGLPGVKSDRSDKSKKSSKSMK
jgi:hypothetical protein